MSCQRYLTYESHTCNLVFFHGNLSVDIDLTNATVVEMNGALIIKGSTGSVVINMSDPPTGPNGVLTLEVVRSLINNCKQGLDTEVLPVTVFNTLNLNLVDLIYGLVNFQDTICDCFEAQHHHHDDDDDDDDDNGNGG